MFKSCTIFIFLCVLVSVTRGQSLGRADSLFDSGDYALAAVEYERCVFLSESRETTSRALRQKALCYKSEGRFAEAAATIERYVDSYADHYQLALCRYLAADYQGASSTVRNYSMWYDSVDRDMLLIQMLALNEQKLYDSARAVSIQLAERHKAIAGEDLMPLLDSLYDACPKMKDETVGFWLSFIPGLGHAYAGNYAMGVGALLLNATVVTFGVWQLLEHCYVTAYLGGAGMLNITYLGSMRSAAYQLQKTNYQRSAPFNQRFRQMIVGALDK